MYVRRNIRWPLIWKFAWRNLIRFSLWSTLVTLAYIKAKRAGLDLSLPFLPISTIGVAVAFYVGFKNSQSYDRFWEARKIWGGIVNASRTFANQVMSYVLPAAEEDLERVHQERKRLIYRHLAWTNALRLQLRRTTIFDRDNLSYVPDLKLRADRDCDATLPPLLDAEEYRFVLARANAATHLLRIQGEALSRLREKEGYLDHFRHLQLMDTLKELYTLQGGCERIKNTPFPRQFAYFSTVFVWIFIFLLPLGLVDEFGRLGHDASVWLTIPFSVLISWVFSTIEIVGDNSEDPFENYVNDVPMTAICRTIEIDLREMLGEEEIPKPLSAVDDILM